MAARKSSRRFQSGSYSTRNLGEPDLTPSLYGSRNSGQRANIFDPVGRRCSVLRQGIENRIRESFELQFVGVGVGSKRPSIDAVLGGKTLECACFAIPREMELALNAAAIAEELKALFKIAAGRHDEREIPETAVHKIRRDGPLEASGRLLETGLNGRDGSTEKTGAVEEMAAVGQQKIVALVALGILSRFTRVGAKH